MAIPWTVKLPRLDETTKRLYDSVLPADARIETRSMFGGLGSFVNGNMFAGALGDRIFVRLSEGDRSTLRQEPGAGPFEPVKGHAMAEYVCFPLPWNNRPGLMTEWLLRGLAWVAGMPPKKGKGKATKKK